MKYKIIYINFILFIIILLSCSYPKKFTQGGYYMENKESFNNLHRQYRGIYSKHPLSLSVNSISSNHASLEIITDSMHYIYNFNLSEKDLSDTLARYGFDIHSVQNLIQEMRNLNSIWITQLNYYENQKKKQLVFISVRHKKLESLFKKNKYFTLAFFEEAQPYDQRGRLRDKGDRNTLRRINGVIFYRVNDKLFFSLSRQFR